MEIQDQDLNALSSISAKDFCKRVYATSHDIYERRLKAIGFSGKEKVLDAGCGFGQWTFTMARMNGAVDGFDFSQERVTTCQNIHDSQFPELKNVKFSQGSIEKINADDCSYDAIFCYSTIFFADYTIALKEFFRVLKPGGTLYFCANDIGWYMYNLMNDHNPSSDFSSKEMAAEAIAATIKFFADGVVTPGAQVIIPVERACDTMKEIGFSKVSWDGEGQINLHNVENIKPFYAKEFMDYVNVYEVLGVK